MRTILGCALTAAILLVYTPARADHAIIRNYGDHPHYIFEIEPHAIVGYDTPFDTARGAFGLGFRGTFHIANGFIRTVNDSVGIGFGVDFAPGTNGVLVPIVLQWNFWLSEHWSIFAEPGFGFVSGPTPRWGPFDPFIFYAGGRLHFTPRIAMTMRLGYPDSSIGVSFLL